MDRHSCFKKIKLRTISTVIIKSKKHKHFSLFCPKWEKKRNSEVQATKMWFFVFISTCVFQSFSQKGNTTILFVHSIINNFFVLHLLNLTSWAAHDCSISLFSIFFTINQRVRKKCRAATHKEMYIWKWIKDPRKVKQKHDYWIMKRYKSLTATDFFLLLLPFPHKTKTIL